MQIHERDNGSQPLHRWTAVRRYDAAVVGGGPAGLSAALWLARYRRQVLVLDAEEPRNRWVDQAHGYLGVDPFVPAELRERALTDLADYPYAERLCEPVTAVSAAGGSYLVASRERQVEAVRVVLATGVTDRFPAVDGFFDHYGADVFHCPTCDGYEARGREVAVLGWNEHVAGFALTLLDWAAAITVVTDGHRFEGGARHREALSRHGIPVVEHGAARFVGPRGALEALELSDGGRIPCSLAFFSLGHEPVTGLARSLGCALDDDGYVVVDRRQRTTVDGVYAAGDVTGGTQLVQIAAAEGATAGIHSALSMRGEPRSTLETGPPVRDELGQ